MTEQEFRGFLGAEINYALNTWRESPDGAERLRTGNPMTIEDWATALGEHAPKTGAIWHLLNWWY